jgi:hypothetical protein
VITDHPVEEVVENNRENVKVNLTENKERRGK